MEILLIRHGKSELVQKGAITLREFEKWIDNYDFHGICEDSICPPETLRKATAVQLILTSDLNRSIESAKLINPKKKVIVSSLFRETELPTGFMNGMHIKLKPGFWAVLLRVLWFMGYSKECESLKEARIRAKKAAQQLIGYSGEFQSVALIGHGFFNMLIAKELRKKGWKGGRKLGAKHWNCVSYFF